ncbi:ead/Ea22-like family protein [Enterobacter ludwigii]|uniref:ead/Ea22-like family protein n=1 Tax=Enterobacter ludwigii TaxID=299767 RepID=UPI000F82038C|nr:ead/Ea22-like family protein [Enterobacter ludwigii]MCM7780398.1 ead/Ea22-like family protein [Enterobacter ludwigii]RTO52653.1 ead/Ea22-like family protein [Enterobacter ludwigii]
MSTNKQALREAAEKATPGRWEYYPGNTSIEYNVDSMGEDQGSIVYVDSGDFTKDQTDRNGEFIAAANPATVLALLDELEAAEALNKHLDLAIRKAEGCSEALRRKLEAAEERIAELSELPMKSDVEKKPQNTLGGRPVYLGDGSDAKETVIAGKRDIHRYESSITNRAWKGD